jgi:tetratricopeptide (TPR) repeat protein
MKSLARKGLLLLVCTGLCVPSFGADDREQPVGLVRDAGGSKLRRAGMATLLAARNSDFLYPGDRMFTTGSPATFTFCPSQESLTLAPASEFLFDTKQVKVPKGKVTDRKPVRACFLPQVIRVAVASQQRYGVGITRGDPTDYPPVPYAQLSAEVKAELQHSKELLAADPSDVYAHITAAAVYEKYNLQANALAEYRALLKPLRDIEWVGQKIFEIESALDTAALKAATPAPGGKTYALLVGVSDYEDQAIPALQFAHADADLLNSFLHTERGGRVSDEDVLILKNKDATTAAVTDGFNIFLKKAQKNDTIVILIAGHGIADASKSVYFATHETSHEDLRSTALALADLTKLFAVQLDHVGRILIFVDICKAGAIEKYNNNVLNTLVQTNLAGEEVPQDNMLLFLASTGKNPSQENTGLRHGVFSYFVEKGLNGDADTNKNGFVEAGEFTVWVTEQVFKYTNQEQKPSESGSMDIKRRIVDLSKPGAKTAHRPVLMDKRNGGPLYLASTSPDPLPFDAQADASLKRFESALTAGRLLPGQADSAFDALDGLKGQLSEDRLVLTRNRLRVALEDAAQRVLLRYLAGEQPSPPPKNYTDAAQYLSAALRLDPGSMFLEGRKDFFEGRAMLFDKKFPDAAALLESSIRIDPGAGYAFNALGIAYLEQSEFKKAIPAFQDAIRRAPHWAYPLHNLGSAYTAIGDYRAAIRSYQDAIRLTPQYAYLPYNLGVVYQRMNRRKEAEAAYRQAIAVDSTLAAPYNNLGSLKALDGKRADAERFYSQALERNPKFLEARHNLALLLASDKSRLAEALALWRQNLEQDRDYVPSRLSLAQTLASSGDGKTAIDEYRRVLQLKPAYVAARLELARLLAASGDSEDALFELREAARRNSTNSAIFEQIGNLEAGRNRWSDAAAAYKSALALAPDRAARKRVEKKLKLLPAP